MKGFFLSLLRHWGAAAIFIGGIFTNALITKIIESNDLGWLQAIWAAVAGCVVWLYNGFLSSVPVPVWLLLPVVGLALIPVWQYAQRIHIAALKPTLTTDQEVVLRSVLALEEIAATRATIANIMRHAGCSKLVAEAALDVLCTKEFVHAAFSFNSDNWYTLKPDGRAYLLERALPTT